MFLAEPLYFFSISAYLAKIESQNASKQSTDDSYKLFFSKYFYDYLVLVEDWKHVITF